MPNAEPFKALTRGNGFPYCLDAIDVSDATYHSLTFQQAMKAYWLFEQLNCTISARLNAPTAPAPFNLFTSVENIPLVDGRDFVNTGTTADNAKVLEPYKRVCGTPYYIADNIYKIARQDPDEGTAFAGISVDAFPNIQRLYNGDVNNEENFVGYGLEGSLNSFGISTFRLRAYTGGFGGGQARVDIGSYMKPFTSSGGYQTNLGTITLNVDDENINFVMRQRLRLTGSDSFLSKTFSFTDNGCEGKSVFTADPSITFQHCKVNVTGFNIFTFN